MQSSTSQPIKTQPLTPNIRTIPSPTEVLAPRPTSISTTNGSVPPISQSQYPDVSQFTFLPDLYLIISRLAPLRQTLSEPNTNGVNNTTASAASTTSQPPDSGLSQTMSRESQLSGSGSSLRHISSVEGSIEIKDLPAHVYGVKQAIMRAKETVAGLPDVGRSVDVQEAEIVALKRRIAGLKGRLTALSVLAAGGEGNMEEGGMI